MPPSPPSSLAFQPALSVSVIRQRHPSCPLLSPLRPSHATPPRRRHIHHVPLVSAISSASTVLKDVVVPVPSTIPADRHRPVDVSLRAESLGGRRRRVVGGIDIAASPTRVWAVLTAYEAIERYMPNIISSSVVSRRGVLYLDQVGVISNKLRLRSRMLVRVAEDDAQRTIAFTRVEGRDFSEFEGRYFIRDGNNGGVRLDYEMVAMPFPLFPMYLVERKIFKEIPKMLASVREESLVGRYIAFKED